MINELGIAQWFWLEIRVCFAGFMQIHESMIFRGEMAANWSDEDCLSTSTFFFSKHAVNHWLFEVNEDFEDLSII